MRVVREKCRHSAVPLYTHPEWSERFPWLVQGTTARGDAQEPFDLRLSGSLPAGSVLDRWRRLREATGSVLAVHGRQVHGAALLVHGAAPPGLLIADAYDAHATRVPGVLLTVSVADCVPISLVDAERRAIALLHGGWRGIAAGVLREGVTALEALGGSAPEDLWMHCGPAICGRCYEVGAEVPEAIGLESPGRTAHVDLPEVLASRAVKLGLVPERISRSAYCTKCGAGGAAAGAMRAAASSTPRSVGPAPTPFFSHRAGSPGRQVGLLAIRGDTRPA